MEDLIAALTILLKYENPHFPTHCEHDVLNVNIDSEQVSLEDIDKLDSLGFYIDDDNTFSSTRFGSC